MMRILFGLVIIFVALHHTGHSQTGDIKVTVSGIRQIQGSILASIFDSAEGFPEDSKKTFSSLSVIVEGSTQSFYLKNIPFGNYAVAVVHDRNNNGKFDKNFLGIPKEGYAVSNNVKGLSAPGFDEASFRLNTAEKTIELHLIYF